MARDGQLGRVREQHRPGREIRYRIDFGRRWKPRFLYSFRGQAFETREMAEGMLGYIRVEVAKGRGLEDVLSEMAPHHSVSSAIEPLLKRWIELFRKQVEAGDRQPRTLKDYVRWSGAAEDSTSHFSYWYEGTIFDVDEASLEDWSYWLADRGLGVKTRRNVMAGFRSFLAWVAKQRRSFEIPTFPWPEPNEHLPRILSRDIQSKVIDSISLPKRGIYLALADLLLRPSEARVLRIRDWTGDEIRVERASKDHRVQGEIRGTKKRRGVKVLPVSGRLREWLEMHVPNERRIADPDGPLFWNPDGLKGGWWSHWTLTNVWHRACDGAGIERVGVYEGTKHSTATHLKSLGADDRLLAAIMGHTDPRSVEKYAKVQGSGIRDALAQLDPRRPRPSEPST